MHSLLLFLVPMSGPDIAVVLDLDSVKATDAVAATAPSDATSLALALALSIVLVASIGFAAWSARGRRVRGTLSGSAMPVPARLAITGALLIFALVHALAAASVYLNTREVYATAAEYFAYMKPARLASLSHAHLMGIAMMDLVAAVLYSLLRGDSPVRRAVVVAAFGGIVADIASWWLTKYAGAGFEILSTVSGAVFTTAFLWMATGVLAALWLRFDEVKQ